VTPTSVLSGSHYLQIGLVCRRAFARRWGRGVIPGQDLRFVRESGCETPSGSINTKITILFRQRVYNLSLPAISLSSWILARSAKEIEYLLLGDLFISRYLGDDSVKRPHRERPVKRYGDS